MRSMTLAGPLLALAALAPAAARAEVLPRMEAGMGIGTLYHPHYRGSGEYGLSAFPLPYLVYRGDQVRLNREGLRARLFDLDRLNLTLSAAASLPGSDGEASRREGMAKLLPTFEAGPSLDWSLHRPDSAWAVRLRLPVRAVVATDLTRFDAAGWLVHPHLHASRESDRNGWTLLTTIGAGPVWATRKYHAYFYEVGPADARPGRPAYVADGGYSGARMALFAGVRYGEWRTGLGVLVDWLDGAAFEDSPLVESGLAIVAGAGVSYRFWSSAEPGFGRDE